MKRISDLAIKINIALALVTLVGMIVALYMVFEYAPTEVTMGEVQRIFYFHVASAWLAMIAFVVVFAGSIMFLWKGHLKYDRLAAASAEIGVLFTTIVLVTGPIWARPIWNAWWTWDPRLTSSLVLWIMYLAYLLLRSNLPESRKKLQFSAVYAIVAFLDVPIVFFSIRWWRTQHPSALISTRGINLEPEMLMTLLVSCLAFTLLYVLLLRFRLMIDTIAEGVDTLKRIMMERED